MRIGDLWQVTRQRLGLGPTRAELRAEVELWQSRAERAGAQTREAYRRAKAAERLNRVLDHKVSELVELVHERLAEPAREGNCVKVRFHEQDEARSWADSIAVRTGEDPADYITYDCKVCPRSPVTMRRFWHAGHPAGEVAVTARAERARRQGLERGQHRRNGALVEQRVDAATLGKLLALKKSPRPEGAQP